MNKNYEQITEQINSFILTSLAESHKKGLVFGLSGGLDSATMAYLCSNAVKDNEVIYAIMMPDTDLKNANQELDDARLVITALGLKERLIPLSVIKKAVIYNSLSWEPKKETVGNISARLRANILYAYAKEKDLLVVGTGDKSEYYIGFFTKFGDGACDIMPIGDLYKTEVRELARYLHVPERIITKPSSPNLWNDHTAEGEIGISYENIDAVLRCIVDESIMSLDRIARKTGLDAKQIQRIADLYFNSEHKRMMPKICKLDK
jgi:NAD+ synthase